MSGPWRVDKGWDFVMNGPEVSFLVDGLIPVRSIGMIWAAPNTGKTLLLVDLIMACIAGSKWAGSFDVHKQMTICLITTEGVRDLRKRIAAAAELWGVSGEDLDARLLIVTECPVDLVNDNSEGSSGKFIAYCEEHDHRPDLIIWDTLQNATEGSEENESRVAGTVLKHARELTNALGCAHLLSHHPGKDGRTYRGSSVYGGAMDYILRIVGHGQEPRTVTCEKLKFGPLFAPLMFRVEAFDFKTPSIHDNRSAVIAWGHCPSQKLQDRVLALLGQDSETWLTVPAIAQSLSVSGEGVRRAIKPLLTGERLESRKRAEGKGEEYSAKTLG